MAIAFVNAGYANPGSTASALTQTQNVTTGNALVVFVGWNTSGVTVTSVTDTAGNTYTPLTQQASSTLAFGQAFYALNVTGNASNRVTVNFSGSTFCRVYCLQYSGVATTSAFDEEANTGVTSTSAATSNVTIPDNGILVAGAFFRDDRSPTWDAAFTSRGDISNITVADRIVTTGVTDAAELSWTTSAYVVLNSLVLKEAVSSPTAPNPPTGVSVSSITRTTANVSWSDTSSDEDGFEVEIAASPYSSWSSVSGSPTAANTTSISLSGLTEGTTYKVRCRSFDADAESEWAESSAFTTLVRYLKITDLVAAAIGETSVAGVVWGPPSGSDLVGTKIAEFSNKTITNFSGYGGLKIPLSELSSSLTPSDIPKVYLQGSSKSTPIFDAAIVDEA